MKSISPIFKYLLGTTIVSLVFVSSLSAQFFKVASRPVQPGIGFWRDNANRNDNSKESNLYYKNYASLGEYNGTPYVLDSLSAARVVDLKGDVFEVRYFNIDAYSDEFIVSKTNNFTDEDYIWLNKKNIDYVVVADISGEGKVNRYFKNIELIDESLGICEVLINDEENGIQVYRKHNRRFTDVRKGTNIIADKPARFGSYEEIYVYKVKEGLKRIKNEKAFLKLFGDDAKKVKKLMKELNLDYDKSEDLETIFRAFPEIELS